MLRALIPLLLTAWLARPAAGQLSDAFSDGDFTADPAWSGEADGWAVVPRHGDPALRTRGRPDRDTTHLVVPSSAAYGSWHLRFGYGGVNLSSFNNARVYLLADAPELEGLVYGYFLQLGAGNTDEIRLYRQDGDPASGRVELGRSEPLLVGDEQVVDVTVRRSDRDAWTVEIDGRLVIEAVDSLHRSSRFFGFWVKHTADGADRFYFDDVRIDGAPGRRDDQPPRVRFVDQTTATELEVFFSEPTDLTSLRPGAFRADGAAPSGVHPTSPASCVLQFDRELAGPLLHVDGVRDRAGLAVEPAAHPIARLARPGDVVLNELLFDPRADRYDGRPDQPEYLELYNRSDRRVSLRGLFRTRDPDEDGDADTLRLSTEPVAIEPGGYALIFAQPPPAAPEGSSLQLAFPGLATAAPGVLLVPVRGASLNLRNGGDLVRLHRHDGLPIEAVAYRPAWHHPNVVDATGIALERIDPDGPSDDRFNWTTSTDPSGGTPGRANGVPPAGERASEPAAVDVSPSPFSIERDGVTAIRYRLTGETALLRARLFDVDGRLVRTLEQTRLVGATGHLYWDGLDDAGARARPGLYVVLVEALDARSATERVYKTVVVLARATR